MTRKKPVETEVVEGAGASSRLVLIVKAGTKSGYAGVTPNGKLWRARIYKAAKKQWDTVGTYGCRQRRRRSSWPSRRRSWKRGLEVSTHRSRGKKLVRSPSTLLACTHVCSAPRVGRFEMPPSLPNLCSSAMHEPFRTWARRKNAAADQSGYLLLACIRPSHAHTICRVCATADHVCALRPQISPHHRSLPTPKTGRTCPRSIRCSSRRSSLIGPPCWAP